MTLLKITISLSNLRHVFGLDIRQLIMFCVFKLWCKISFPKGGRFHCINIDVRKDFDEITKRNFFQNIQSKGVNGGCFILLKKCIIRSMHV
jgi:hypothetical protein